MMEQRVVESGINTQILKLVDEVPECLRKNAEVLQLDLENEIRSCVNEYLVVQKKASPLPYLSQPVASQPVYNLNRKKLYNLKKIKSDFDKNHKLFQAGAVCEDISLFSMYRVMSMLESRDKDKFEDQVVTTFNTWYDQMKISTDARAKSQQEWVGFSSYIALDLYRDNKRKFFQRLVNIDICDFVVYHSMVAQMQLYYIPETVLDAGMFAAGRGSRTKNKTMLLSDVKDSPAGRIAGFTTEEVTVITSNLQLAVSGKDEQAVLMWLFTKAIQNSTADMMSYEVSGSLVDICKIIYPGEKKFSSRNYEYAKEVFSHLLYTRIWADDMKTSVPLLGKTSAEWLEENGDGGTSFVAKLGQDLMSDLMFSRIGLVFQDQIAQLEKSSGLSKIMYPKLRKDRVNSILINNVYTTTYTLRGLMFLAKPVGRYKPDRIEEYKQAFQEMKDKQILVNDYEFTRLPSGDEAFVLTWLPLTRAEADDARIIRTVSQDDLRQRHLEDRNILENL